MEFFSQMARSKSLPNQSPTPIESGSVLLIDTDESFRQTVATELRQGGIALVETGDVERAFDNLEAMQPDLVVCDASELRNDQVLNWLQRLLAERQHITDFSGELPIIFLAVASKLICGCKRCSTVRVTGSTSPSMRTNCAPGSWRDCATPCGCANWPRWCTRTN